MLSCCGLDLSTSTYHKIYWTRKNPTYNDDVRSKNIGFRKSKKTSWYLKILSKLHLICRAHSHTRL